LLRLLVCCSLILSLFRFCQKLLIDCALEFVSAYVCISLVDRKFCHLSLFTLPRCLLPIGIFTYLLSPFFIFSFNSLTCDRLFCCSSILSCYLAHNNYFACRSPFVIRISNLAHSCWNPQSFLRYAVEDKRQCRGTVHRQCWPWTVMWRRDTVSISCVPSLAAPAS
jgi:hypothetical protein